MSLDQIKRLVRGPITPLMISYITQKAATVIPCDPPSSSPNGLLLLSMTNNNNGNSHHDQENMTVVPPLHTFIQRLVSQSNVSTGTFLSTLVYLDRLKTKLPKLARGMHCTCHRVFLATLIVACKYLNDTSPRNKHWARYSRFFSIHKINLMERQLLSLLDFDLRINEAELVKHLGVFCTGDNRLQVMPNLVLPSQPPLKHVQNHRLQNLNAPPLQQITAPQHHRCHNHNHHHHHRRRHHHLHHHSLPHSLSKPSYSRPQPRFSTSSLPLPTQLSSANLSINHISQPPPQISISASPSSYIPYMNSSYISDDDQDLIISDEEYINGEEVEFGIHDDDMEFEFSDTEQQYIDLINPTRRRGSVQSNGSSSAGSSLVATPRDFISSVVQNGVGAMVNNPRPVMNQQATGLKYFTTTTNTMTATALTNCNSYGKSFLQPPQDIGVRRQYLNLPPLTMVPTTGGQQYVSYGSRVV